LVGDHQGVNHAKDVHEEPKDHRPGWIEIIGVFLIPVIVVIAVVTVLILTRAPRPIFQMQSRRSL
jgi:hypothetical protein